MIMLFLHCWELYPKLYLNVDRITFKLNVICLFFCLMAKLAIILCIIVLSLIFNYFITDFLYASFVTEGLTCPYIFESGRQECGFLGIDKSECESEGCCWDENSQDTFVRCHHRGKIDLDVSEVFITLTVF